MSPNVWVLGTGVDDALLERLGDARRIADAIGCGVAALVFGTDERGAADLIARGADAVQASPSRPDIETLVASTEAALVRSEVLLVFAPGDPRGREWAALLAASLGWTLVSPALMARRGEGGLEITGLDPTGRLARRVRPGGPAIVTLRPGVGEALPADPARRGTVAPAGIVERPSRFARAEFVPADPATVDIRHAPRLVAGGRGLGDPAGFDLLRRFAERIGAGVAASRMAVDLGWIEAERQVGQTGRTVAPDLYIACGISGASHHLEGMTGSRHIVAINVDPQAPIFRVAHLGLVADLHDVLERARAEIGGR